MVSLFNARSPQFCHCPINPHIFLILFFFPPLLLPLFFHGSSFFHRLKGEDFKPTPKTRSYQGSNFWEPCQLRSFGGLHGPRITLQTHPRPRHRRQNRRRFAAFSAAAASSYFSWRLPRHVIPHLSTTGFNWSGWGFCCIFLLIFSIAIGFCNFFFFFFSFF